ncbi:hypothetical protein K2Q02_01615 [Patescibacteria group bacterium]|nr:hypothetical protein [Patescibacteria group bacterium]
MKKMFFVVLAIGMIVSTYAKAQKSNYSAFSLSRSPSLSSFKGQIKNLLVKRDNTGWNPTAEKHYLEYFAKKFPGKSPQQIIDGTSWEKIPTGTYLKSVGRISKTTGELSFWGRYSRPNEYQGSYQGIPWTLSDCGNLYPGETQMLAVVDEEPDDYVAEATQPRERIIERRVESQIVQAPAPQIIYVQAPVQVQPQVQQVVYTPPVQQIQYVQQPVMQQQQQMQTQYANNGPQEIIVRQKRDALDYIDLAFKGANTWFNGVNTYRGIRFEQNNQTVNYGQNVRPTWTRPDRPGRPPYQPPVTETPWQGGSGSYPNPYYGNNSNGAGLGSGDGTIWGNGNNTGGNTGNSGYTYRLPVSPNRVY